jgi:hypothetical protein
MALSKAELLRGGVSDQQALVKKLQEQTPTQPRKRKIPGGGSILETIDQKDMEGAVYNWLRGCRAFSQVTISFAKEPSKFRCKVQKIKEFDANAPREIWEMHPEGKQHLAQQIADVLNNHQAVMVVAKKDGIWLHTDATNTFTPSKAVTSEDVAEQQKLVAEVKAEMIEEGRDPGTLQFKELQEGDQIPSDDWEPYVEFIPKRKQEYGR